MSIYWEAFTPWSSLAGGVLIGLAAALMVVLLGRIAGISGILGGLLQKATWGSVRQWGWRAAFVAGLHRCCGRCLLHCQPCKCPPTPC